MSHVTAYTENASLKMDTFDIHTNSYGKTMARFEGPTTQKSSFNFFNDMKEPKDIYLQCGPFCCCFRPRPENEPVATRHFLKNAKIENLTFIFFPGGVVRYKLDLLAENKTFKIAETYGKGWIKTAEVEWIERESKAFPERLMICDKAVTKAGFEQIGVDKNFLDKLPTGVSTMLNFGFINLDDV
jgi:hypothetical protein